MLPCRKSAGNEGSTIASLAALFMETGVVLLSSEPRNGTEIDDCSTRGSITLESIVEF